MLVAWRGDATLVCWMADCKAIPCIHLLIMFLGPRLRGHDIMCLHWRAGSDFSSHN